MILIADNFQYQGRKPLDSRIIVDTIVDMKAIAESIIYEGILVYNKETKKFYSFDPANTVDPTLGKWREFESSGGASIVEYAQDTTYKENNLIIYNDKLYLATTDFTSSNVGPTIADDFAVDITAVNLIAVSTDGGASLLEYKQNTAYKKDNLIYLGDRLGRVAADFTSDSTAASVEESFALDVDNNKIIVDKIDISELDSQLLKALPIVAFVTKHDIPRFESNMIISGTIPKFRDGTALTTIEKKGCNFLYIVDANGELTGLAIVVSYNETDDEFTVNAMKYGVGTSDNILPANNILTKRTVGETQIVYKDDLLAPVLVVKATAPVDTNSLWYQSTALDASDIHTGTMAVQKYDTATTSWIAHSLDVKESDVVKNGNGSTWEYYRIQSNGNVFISLANWQLVYDTNQILGKIIDINTTTHEVTIKTIHANAESDAVLEEDIQANVAIGAAAANFKYPKDMTFTEFVKKIAIKDILATLNFTASGSGLIKKGTTINGSNLTATLAALGNVPIKKIKFYDGNTMLSENNYVDGTITYTEVVTSAITTDKTFAAVVEQDGNQTVRKEAKFVFVNPTYVGAVNSLTPADADILAFTENLKTSFKGSYTVTMADARTCIAYPTSMGNITSIKDKNNFEYINSFTKTTRTLNGETYNVYILTDSVTATNFVWTIN